MSTSCQLGTLLAKHAGEMCTLSEVSSTDLLLQQKSFPLILLTEVTGLILSYQTTMSHSMFFLDIEMGDWQGVPMSL